MQKWIVLAAWALVACAPATSPSSPSSPATPDSDAVATPAAAEPTDAEIKTLAQTYIQDLKALNTELEPSGVHGENVKTFLDEKALSAHQNKAFPFENGTLSFKESYNGGSVTRLYMMQKIEGYDSANNDWFYAVMSPEGEVSQRGKVAFCISCHAKARDRDFIYGFE